MAKENRTMLFAAIYRPVGVQSEETQKRGLKLFTNWQSPSGFGFKAHFFRADGNGGIAIVEAESASSLMEGITPWTAFFQFEVTPVVDASEGVPIQMKVNAWRDSIR
jgi:hypothetical protein